MAPLLAARERAAARRSALRCAWAALTTPAGAPARTPSRCPPLQGGLSLKKNPLLVSIIDGCETLKALVEKQQLKGEDVAAAKALIVMRTDKVGRGRSGAQGRSGTLWEPSLRTHGLGEKDLGCHACRAPPEARRRCRFPPSRRRSALASR